MAARILSWVSFAVLMTVILLGSLVVVVLLYLPYVALKAVVQTLRGKERVRAGQSSQPTPHIG